MHNSTTYHLYTVLCILLPPIKSPSVTNYPPIPFSTTPTCLPPPRSHQIVVGIHVCFSFCSILPSPSQLPPPLPSSCQPALYGSVSLFLVSAFCLLDSIYEWNFLALVTALTQENIGDAKENSRYFKISIKDLWYSFILEYQYVFIFLWFHSFYPKLEKNLLI